MPGDFSRSSFEPENHFTGIRLQQGRVQVDADFNELADILQHRIATEIKDFIGMSGAPSRTAGFEIKPNWRRLTIGKGRYYVDGILCENEQDHDFLRQTYYPLPFGDRMLDHRGEKLDIGEIYVVVLDVWERELTALDDPRMADPALEGADTSTRTQTVSQVKLMRLDTPELLKSIEDGTNVELDPDRAAADKMCQDLSESFDGKLLTPSVAPDSPGLENQLYRIEIHRGGALHEATFKWSRDNASIACRGSLADRAIRIERWTQGSQNQFRAGDWIEITSPTRQLNQRSGVLVQIRDMSDGEFVLSEMNQQDQDEFEGEEAVIVIRWDGVGSSGGHHARADGLGVSESPQEVEQGLRVAFAGNVEYQAGDFWMIPSRRSENRLLWPDANEGDGYAPRRPHGVRHHFAPLALERWSSNGWEEHRDLRFVFDSLVHLDDKVSKSGDIMSGPLRIENNLQVSGNVGLGTEDPKIRLAVGQSDTGLDAPQPGQLTVRVADKEHVSFEAGERDWEAVNAMPLGGSFHAAMGWPSQITSLTRRGTVFCTGTSLSDYQEVEPISGDVVQRLERTNEGLMVALTQTPDGMVILWNKAPPSESPEYSHVSLERVGSGEPLAEERLEPALVQAALHPNGKAFLAATRSGYRWVCPQGHIEGDLELHHEQHEQHEQGWVKQLSISPDGRLAAAATTDEGGQLFLWRITGKSNGLDGMHVEYLGALKLEAGRGGLISICCCTHDRVALAFDYQVLSILRVQPETLLKTSGQPTPMHSDQDFEVASYKIRAGMLVYAAEAKFLLVGRWSVGELWMIDPSNGQLLRNFWIDPNQHLLNCSADGQRMLTESVAKPTEFQVWRLNIPSSTMRVRAPAVIDNSFTVAEGNLVFGVPVIDFKPVVLRFHPWSGGRQQATANIQFPSRVLSAHAMLSGWGLETQANASISQVHCLPCVIRDYDRKAVEVRVELTFNNRNEEATYHHGWVSVVVMAHLEQAVPKRRKPTIGVIRSTYDHIEPLSDVDIVTDNDVVSGSVFDTLLDMGADAIVIDKEEVEGDFSRAKEDNVAVVTLDPKTAERLREVGIEDAYVGEATRWASKALVGELARRLRNNDPAPVAILSDAHHTLEQVRHQQLLLALNESNNFSLIEEANLLYSPEQAQSFAEDLMVKHEDLALILVTNEQFLRGVVQAVEAAGKLDRVLVAGFASDERLRRTSIELAEAHVAALAIDQPFPNQSEKLHPNLAIDYALKLLLGEKPQEAYLLI